MERKVYNIKPLSGEALLNYNGRLAANDIYMKVYSLDEKQMEKVNENKSDLNGEIFEADCLSVCAYLKDNNQEVDFVYIDPPFASNINYTKKIFLRNKNKKEQLIGRVEEGRDKEIMYNEIWSKEDYLNWLYTRLIAIREVLSENGSIMLHVNWNIGHYAKVLMDEVFGEENFRNEIIWAYRTGGASKKNSLARKHDTIMFYSKNSTFEINSLTERSYLEKGFMGSPVDENGRFYSDTILRDVLDGSINIVEEDGTITEYNVQPPLNLSSEFLDYGNQRSEDLLKILIRIATNEGDVVADFFGGSGTTARAAYELNRKFLTCDIEKNSTQITRDELKKRNATFNVYKINDGINLFKDPVQIKKTIIELNSGEIRNENSEYSAFWDGKIFYNDKMIITKILNNDEILTYDYIEFLLNQMTSDISNNKECVLIYFYKDVELSKTEIKKFIEEKNLDFNVNILSIEEMTQNISSEIFDEDSAYITLDKNVDNTYKLVIEKFFSPYLDKIIKEENSKKKYIEIKYNGLEYIESVSIDTTMNKYWTSNIEDKASKVEFIKGEYILDTECFKIKIRDIAGREIIINSKEVKKKYER